MKESIIRYGKLDSSVLEDRELALAALKNLDISPDSPEDLGYLINELFEVLVQPNLIKPTFITSYPTAVSPLARRNDNNPDEVDRFELFINGQEIANGFSELNDPIDQRARFEKQCAARKPDEEAAQLDEDFIQALECGMPPAAGEGIGIDRLVMLFCNAASIRDVILFPLLKPER